MDGKGSGEVFPLHHITQRENNMDETDDILVKTSPLLEMVKTLGEILSSDRHASEMELFRTHERTGRPLGKMTFVKQLETILDRRLRPKKTGSKEE